MISRSTLYIAVLRNLQQAKTTMQLAEHLGCKTVVALRHALRLMRHHCLIHVAGWDARTHGGINPVLWLAGSGIEPTPTGSNRLPLPRPMIRSEMIAFASLVEALERGPLTRLELASETGIRPQTISGLVRRMMDGGLIHIERWDRNARNPQAAYVWGPGTNAQRPKAEHHRAIELRYYAKRKVRRKQERMMRALSADGIYALAA